MGLSAFQILDILELIFFTPALIASGYVVYKHGARKQLGWRFLVMICLFRLIGAITSLINVDHPSTGLVITTDIMYTFGLSAVIYTALGLIHRVDDGTAPRNLPFQLYRILGLPGLAGLILSIIGSINLFGNGTPGEIATGYSELKAAVCLFLSVYVADILITANCLFKISYVQDGERRLLFCVVTALPFMAVRMTYSLVCVFTHHHKWFSTFSMQWQAILVHGIMGVLMEAIVVCIFLFAGLTTAVAAKPVAPGAHAGKVTYDLDARRV